MLTILHGQARARLTAACRGNFTDGQAARELDVAVYSLRSMARQKDDHGLMVLTPEQYRQPLHRNHYLLYGVPYGERKPA